MAALNRPTEANYEVHENVRVDTQGMLLAAIPTHAAAETENKLAHQHGLSHSSSCFPLQTMRIIHSGEW